MDPRPTPRYTYERRQRLHRAMLLRRRMRVRQAGLLLGSLLTVTLSLSIVMLINHITQRTPAAPLFVIDDGSLQHAADTAVPGVTRSSESGSPAPQPVTAPTPAAPGVTRFSESGSPAPAPAPAPAPQIQIHNDDPADSQPAALAPVKHFGSRPVRAVRTMHMLVTAYCPGPCCCGKHADGITASGKSIDTNAGHLVAADTRILPFNSLLSIPGYDHQSVVPVLDRGGKIKGNRLDLLFPTHAQAKQWGAQWLDVTIYEYVE